jgi:predicted ATPase/DNA-binding SARP family transcriptional activator
MIVLEVRFMTESVFLAATQHTSEGSLHITLLGPPQLTLAGMPMPLPRRQVRALLYRLAVELQPVPREQLCFLLWAGIPEAAARRHLTVLLNQLRQVLPLSDIVLTGRDLVALDSAGVYVDTVAFAEARAAAARSGALEPLADAVQLYKGPFLHGFSLPASTEFDAWVSQEQQHWERRYLDALAALVDGYATSGAYAQAIAAAQRVLAVDELAEDMHRTLIQLYAAAGDRAAALRQFERCVLILDRELGVSPLPETRAVYDAVRAGHVPLRREAGGGTLVADRFLGRVAPPANETLLTRAALATPRTSLPAPSTPLIGRQAERAATAAFLTDPTVRLLTLTGPGGSGKTRLALQAAWDAADQFADGAVFVALAPLRDPALVVQTIGHACNLTQPSPAALAEYLSDKQLLLVLDNCEHLLAAAPEIAALLAAAPGLRVLATSRAALNLRGEHTFPVPPLLLPNLAPLPSLAELADVPSVALLLSRTLSLNPRFGLTADNAPDLAAICARLDGLPLAIELAAARLKLLSPRDLLRRLDRRLTLLTQGSRDLPERQQTLHATIDWSYRLLSFTEQLWFERCSVFAGGWTLAALEALDERVQGQIAPYGPDDAAQSHILDVLTVLVEKSLVHVHVDEDGDMRFNMLETIREFAAERLHERGSFEMVAQAHADYFRDLIEPWDVNAPEWLTRIERDHDNFRAAVRWYLERTDGITSALQLGAKLGAFWYRRDYRSEGRWWLEQILARSESIRTPARAEVLYRAALLTAVLGDIPGAIALQECVLPLCQEFDLAAQQALSLSALGTLFCRQGDFRRARAMLEESLRIARAIGAPRPLCSTLINFAGVLVDEGQDLPYAIALYEESLMIARDNRLVVNESLALMALGMALALNGEYAQATKRLEQAQRMQREQKLTMGAAYSLQYLGLVAYFQEDYITARRYFVESLSLALPSAVGSVPTSLEGLAGIASIRRQPTRAARLLGAAEALREAHDVHLPPIEQAHYQRIVASVRAQISRDVLNQAWQAGRRLSVKPAIAEAEAFAHSEAKGDWSQERNV